MYESHGNYKSKTYDIQEWRGKEHKHSTKGNHQTAREEAKRRMNGELQK